MNLQEFISSTITQIDDSTKDTKYQLLGHNPAAHHQLGGKIDFDIAVIATETDSGKGGGEVKVLGLISAGGTKEKASEVRNTSRIKFSLVRN